MTAPAAPVRPNTAPALIRTLVPIVVGAVLAWLASRGLDLTAYENAVNVYLPPVLGGLYYAAVFALEKRWPAFGWLLGYARQPQYVDETGAAVPPPTVEPRYATTGGHVRPVDPVARADAAARRDDPLG